jgi:hypothetical protein
VGCEGCEEGGIFVEGEIDDGEGSKGVINAE